MTGAVRLADAVGHMRYTTAETLIDAMREVREAVDVLREKRKRLERLLVESTAPESPDDSPATLATEPTTR